MERISSSKPRRRAGIGLAIVAGALYVASIALVGGADAKTNAKPAKNTGAKTEKKKLTGAELYSTHCNRCHAERYATERTDAQWKTVLMHMQVRAQLPGKDAKEILKYLQENN